jgi:thiol-disulfide isomerase/thioredoxin
MRTLLAAMILCGFTACSKADSKDAPKADDAKKTKLKIGSTAPALTIQKWLNGKEVKNFEKGKVYVLDFWATWCGPCIQAMPHLAELSKEHEKAGLVVFPVTTVGRGNSLDAIQAFVTKRGPGFGFPFAVCENEGMEEAWMQAAGADGIPTSFVVDKEGKIAFIGHPMELDDVLPMVLDGTWKGEESLKAIRALDEEMEAIQEKAKANPVEALTALEAFVKKNPKRENSQAVIVSKLAFHLQAKKFDEAKAFSETLIADGIKAKKSMYLELVANIWASKELNPDKKHIDLLVKAAEAMLTLEPKDALTNYKAGQAYLKSGDKAKAIALTNKAIELAEDDNLKDALKKALEKFEK